MKFSSVFIVILSTGQSLAAPTPTLAFLNGLFGSHFSGGFGIGCSILGLGCGQGSASVSGNMGLCSGYNAGAECNIKKCASSGSGSDCMVSQKKEETPLSSKGNAANIKGGVNIMLNGSKSGGNPCPSCPQGENCAPCPPLVKVKEGKKECDSKGNCKPIIC